MNGSLRLLQATPSRSSSTSESPRWLLNRCFFSLFSSKQAQIFQAFTLSQFPHVLKCISLLSITVYILFLPLLSGVNAVDLKHINMKPLLS